MREIRILELKGALDTNFSIFFTPCIKKLKLGTALCFTESFHIHSLPWSSWIFFFKSVSLFIDREIDLFSAA